MTKKDQDKKKIQQRTQNKKVRQRYISLFLFLYVSAQAHVGLAP
jgi:fucose permease